MTIDFKESRTFQSGEAAIGSYRYREAAQFIEFCVELDNQDDRQTRNKSRTVSTSIDAEIDPTQWQLIYDSRRAIADDVFDYAHDPSDQRYAHWAKLYSGIVS